MAPPGVQNLTTLSGTENVIVDSGGSVLAQANTQAIANLVTGSSGGQAAINTYVNQHFITGISATATLVGTEQLALFPAGSTSASETASMAVVSRYINQNFVTGTATATLLGTEQVMLGLTGSMSASEYVSTSTIAGLWSSGAWIDQSYTTSAVTTAIVVTLSNNRTSTFLVLTQSSTQITVSLPTTPVNGQIARFSFNQGVSSLTITTGTQSPTVSGVTTSILSGGFALGFTYDSAAATWYRSA